jgi:hypothetical protein
VLQCWVLFFNLKGNYLGFCINIFLVSTAIKMQELLRKYREVLQHLQPQLYGDAKIHQSHKLGPQIIELIGESL